MPEKNPYESQNTVDIPDFIGQQRQAETPEPVREAPEEEPEETYEYEEEEYEEEEEMTEERNVLKGRRLNPNVVYIGLALLAVFFVLTLVLGVYGIKQRNALKVKTQEYDAYVKNAEAKEADYQLQIRDLKAQIKALKEQGGGSITPDTVTSKWTVTADGINVRNKSSIEGEVVGYVNRGDVLTIYGDPVKDADGRQWGRIKENEWVCLFDGSVYYAEKASQ